MNQEHRNRINKISAEMLVSMMDLDEREKLLDKLDSEWMDVTKNDIECSVEIEIEMTDAFYRAVIEELEEWRNARAEEEYYATSF